MLGKEFLQILQNGIMPVIEFTKLCEECDFEPNENMRCQVESYTNVDTDGVYSATCNFKGWKEYNLPFAKREWYDENRNPSLTWFESRYYPNDERYEMFLDMNYEVPFNIVKLNRLYEEYKESESILNYITWLENKVEELRKE